MSDPASGYPRFQFSLRSMFRLTAVVAVVLGTMTALGNTHSFRALGSLHAYLALLPVAGVWAAWRLRLVTPARLLASSFFLYLCALPLPAIALDGDMIPGIFAGFESFRGPFLLFELLLETPRSEIWLGDSACMMGLYANLGYILTFFVMMSSESDWQTHWFPKLLSKSAFIIAVLAIVPLGFSQALDTIYIGYGVWVAAMLAMWLGVREEATSVSTSAGRTGMDAACQSSTSENPDEVDSRAD